MRAARGTPTSCLLPRPAIAATASFSAAGEMQRRCRTAADSSRLDRFWTLKCSVLPSRRASTSWNSLRVWDSNYKLQFKILLPVQFCNL